MGEATTSSRYPIGIQTFEKIREGGYLYVDKTAFVYELAHGSGSTYFLSRPRRFGKSLLLSTMQAYFEGRRELFDGLAISELETAWESHPVIRIDLSTVKTEDQGQLEELLNYTLSEQEALWDRNADAKTPARDSWPSSGQLVSRQVRPSLFSLMSTTPRSSMSRTTPRSSMPSAWPCGSSLPRSRRATNTCALCF